MIPVPAAAERNTKSAAAETKYVIEPSGACRAVFINYEIKRMSIYGNVNQVGWSADETVGK